MKVKNVIIALVAMLILSGCGSVPTEEKKSILGQQEKCKSESVEIEGYGEKGKRLSNCFVEYPGEPSRQDKSYYVLEDICGQFTKEFVGNALGKTITRTKAPTESILYNCRYYWDDSEENVMLVLDYLKAENQKKGNEEMGRRVETDSSIPMNNYVIYQGDGIINSIILIMGEQKFISIQRSTRTGLTNQELLTFASNLAAGIKEYK